MTDAISRTMTLGNNVGNSSSSSSSSNHGETSDRFNIVDSFPIRNGNELTAWFEGMFSPTVLVRTTASVEASCAKNGLKFIDLLRPYQFSKQLNYSSISLQNFSVNFVTLGDLHKEYGENGNRIANRTEVHLREKHHSDFIGHIIKHSYDQYLKKTNQSALNQDLVDHTPWFDIFRDEFIKNLNISEHETFLHPVAVVSVISSEDVGDPIQILKGLFDPDSPPKMFKDFTMDPDILNLVIMIHDQSSPTTNSEKANAMFNKIKEKYTASSCRMLILNSRDHLVENLIGDIWTPVLPRRQLYQKYVLDNIQPNGFYLSKQDVQYIANNVDFIVNQVVASMDAKIKTVSNTVLANKKGIKNAIKSWFTKKTKAEEEGISPEMQLRRLADLLFLLREYDEAYSVYKIISGDFKKDHKNYAGCLEMMAICSLLSPNTQSGNKKEIESNLDNALTSYKTANQPNYTLRLLLIQACYYRSKMLFKKAGELFTRASNVDENNFLQAALFFEQTALCYRGTMDRLTRKSALFLILAGYRYSHTDQMKHSFRCYRTSFRIYNNREWLQIYEHLSYTMGKLTNDMKDLKSSVEFYHEFLTVCKQAPEQQFKFMEVFSQTVSSYINEQKQKGVNDVKFDFLEMPKVDQSNVRVLLNSYYGEPVYTDVVPDEEWAKLEETLVRKVRGPIVFFKWEKGTNDMKKIESTIVGEPIHVDVKISNSLNVAIQVRDICLDAILKTPNLPENEKGFTAESVNVSIQGNDTIVVRLKITPTEPGDLSIRGVRWKILNNIQGFKHFSVKGKRLNENKQQRTSVQYEQDNRLILKVVNPTPLLDVKFTESIDQLWNGELKKTTMIVTNIGKADLKNLKLKINHPSIYFLSDDPKMNNFQFMDASTPQKDSTFISNTYGIERDFTYYDICEGLTTGSNIEIPVFIRGSYSGVHDAKFLFYYEPVEPIEDLKYRLHRFHTTLKVMDSLRVTTFCDSSYSELGSFICGVKLHNLRPDQFIQVDQLVSVSPLWEITPVIPVSGQSIIVMPKESYTVYLKIFKNVEQENKMVGIISAKEKLPDVELIHRSFSTGNSERIVDTTQRPYLEFLFSESKKHELTFFGKTITTSSGDALVDIEEQLNSLSLQTIWRGGPCELGITYHSKVSFLPHAKKPKRIHMAAKFPSKENLICPIEVNLEYEREIIHQFTPSQPSCSVTFDVKISNVSPDLHTDITLELLPPFATSGTSKLRAQSVLPTAVAATSTGPQNFYLWSGPTRFFLKDLKPNSGEVKVTVQATFFSPGVYNLNQFRISWKFMDQSNIARVIPHTFVDEQYLITVVQPEITQTPVSSNTNVDDLFL